MDVGGASGRGVHSCLKAENTMRFYHLVVLREYLACTGPDYLGEARSFYGNRRETRAVRGFKLRFTGLYNAGFPSYTVGYRSSHKDVGAGNSRDISKGQGEGFDPKFRFPIKSPDRFASRPTPARAKYTRPRLVTDCIRRKSCVIQTGKSEFKSPYRTGPMLSLP